MAETKTNGVDGKDVKNGTDSNNDSMEGNQVSRAQISHGFWVLYDGLLML